MQACIELIAIICNQLANGNFLRKMGELKSNLRVNGKVKEDTLH